MEPDYGEGGDRSHREHVGVGGGVRHAHRGATAGRGCDNFPSSRFELLLLFEHLSVLVVVKRSILDGAAVQVGGVDVHGSVVLHLHGCVIQPQFKADSRS